MSLLLDAPIDNVEVIHPTHEKATILFVEDENFVREVTAEVLRSAGYAVLAAKDAIDAVRRYGHWMEKIDLLLTDVILPGETGCALASRLRGENSNLKVLFVTGYPEQMGRPDSAFEALLAKPFSTGALLKSVRSLLERENVPFREGMQTTHACDSALLA